ncbi:ABC transporter permease [Helicobacter sp. MIT 05-5293]|uniref:ABC transporter permease n=1 Tax=Helicobacter sp. MIT 05-5293 TaxID=1548149 RepID=UPI0010FF4883|nr:ABC transporter permease [Helicobacter sp. MIT 05-5293]TLD80110.1 ABC transporter permease [Helicobacter sp. MIT 05-5293]
MKILLALIKKEFKQIIRDPSSIIIAFVLPLISILIYMYGINMDSLKVTLGIKNDDSNSEIATLVKSFGHSKYVQSIVFDNENEIKIAIARSKIKGAVIIPNDFSKKLLKGQNAEILIITDGSDVNTANYVSSYAVAIINHWLASSKFAPKNVKPAINTEIRTWYNQDLNSHHFILPGSIAITMPLIGILLTALVIAREWERGTMEALLSTRVRKIDIVLGKYIPYFTLGMCSMLFNVFLCVFVFGVPFRGSFLILLLVCSLFLFTLLGIGLLISSVLKNQFLASQVSLGIGLLPSLLLSGLMFPINSMPLFFQYFTMILPPRYFVTFVESEFMSGTIPQIVMINSIFLATLGLILFMLVYKKTNMRLAK